MDELRVERVLRAVEALPAGTAMPYGRVGAAVGASARFVGRVMSLHGSAVAWWRVPNARGEFPPPLRTRALPHLEEESTPLTADGRIDLRRAGVDADWFAHRVDAALADLEEADGSPEEAVPPAAEAAPSSARDWTSAQD